MEALVLRKTIEALEIRLETQQKEIHMLRNQLQRVYGKGYRDGLETARCAKGKDERQQA